jgi:hypothetical protein
VAGFLLPKNPVSDLLDDQAKMNNIIKNIVVGIIVVVIGGAILIFGTIKYGEYRVKSAAEDYQRSEFRDAMIKSSLVSLRVKAEILWEKNNPNSYNGFCSYIKDKDTDDNFGTDNLKYLNEMSDNNAYCKISDDNSVYKVSTRLSDGNYYCVDSLGSSKIVESYLAKDFSNYCSF